jgi:DNA-binding protein HU-beta
MAIMTKSELIDRVSDDTEISKALALRVITSLQENIMDAVAEKREVKLTGFAAFGSVTRSARTIRHPLSGDPVTMEEAEVVKIRPLGVFRDRVNDNKS